jgi:hypothetical protein
MKSMREPYEEELKRRLQQYTEEPHEGLWQAISGKMSAEKSATTTAKKLGRQLLGSLLLAALVLSFLVPETLEYQAASFFQPLERKSNPELSHPPEPEVYSVPDTKLAALPGTAERGIEPVVTEENVVLIPQLHRKNDDVRLSADGPGEDGENSADAVIDKTDTSEPVVLKRKSHASLVEPDDPGKRKLTTAEKLMKRRKQEVKYNRFSVYFTVMPTFGYQRIESNTNDNVIV